VEHIELACAHFGIDPELFDDMSKIYMAIVMCTVPGFQRADADDPIREVIDFCRETDPTDFLKTAQRLARDRL